MKLIIKLFIISLLTNACVDKYEMKITNLKCEYKVNPIGVDVVKPRFSWNLESEQRDVYQTSYQILVASNLNNLDQNIGDIWDSKKIESDQSIQILYSGKALESNQKYFWKVKVWGKNDQTQQSDPSFWTSGLFNQSDWKAKWIGFDIQEGNKNSDPSNRKLSARMLRHEFSITKKIKSATAFISGLGLFEFYINGKKIGDQVLSPGLTEYNKRAFYMTFDVTKNLQANKNAIGIVLGNGRYFAPRTIEPANTRTYGFPKAIFQLEISYEDGSSETIISDESWKLTTNGPIRKNNEYDGEYYDARMELDDWNKIGYNDANWIKAKLVDKPGKILIAQPNEPIKIMEEITPIALNKIKPDVFILDMGQNMVGWVELFVKGKKGDKVTLRFAETINKDGSLLLDNMRNAEVTDTYILKGENEEKWEPRFTYHGFRYVEITGYPSDVKLSSIKGKVVHDAIELTGSFESSNPLINSIYKNAYWGIRGNYRSIPTDCPQRDERQGWLGDRSAECTGESFIFDISNLYNKWVTDIKDAQRESGSIPDVAPSYWPFYTDNTTWPGTYLFASEMLYSQYGDIQTIKTNYPYMQKWIKYMSQFLKNDIMPRDSYGDWCVPPEDVKLIHTLDYRRTTNSELIGTAYFYYELKLMEKFAKLLNITDDAKEYSIKAEELKTAFNNKFLDKKYGKYSNNSHTSNILPIAFDLVPDKYKERIVNNLLQKILGESDSHIGNGLIGGQWLMRALTNSGHADVAYILASQKTYPSWGYMVEKGATTIWELWNGDQGDASMNSGNHVMLLGDLIIWFYENLAGIKTDPEVPAFKHIIMKPNVLGDLTFINASYNSIYGKIESDWKLEEDKFIWNVTIPANTRATVYVPTLNKEDVQEGNEPVSKVKGIKFIRWEDNLAVMEIKSGRYSFSSKGVKKSTTKPYVSNAVISPGNMTTMVGDKIMVEIICKDPAATIHYTIDGSEPIISSPIYNKPFEILKNTIVRSQAYMDGYNPSTQTKEIYDFIDPIENGINWKLYKGKYLKLPNFDKITPVAKGKIYQFDLEKIDLQQHNFAIQFESFIQIDKDGEYEFSTSSNDGSKLYINNILLLDNDGEHGPRQVSGTIHLNRGKHLIKVEYFQSGGTKMIQVYYSSDEISYQPIPGSVLFNSKK